MRGLENRAGKKRSAILLTAGRSSRMGQSKALLKYFGESFVAHVTRVISETKLFSEILVIIPPVAGLIEQELASFDVKVHRNVNAETGLMSSLQCGIRELDARSEDVSVFLVDQVPLKGRWIANLVHDYELAHAADSEISLARPFVGGKPIHPVLIGKKHFAEILEQDARDQGAAFLFKKYPEQVLEQNLISEKVSDIDTPEDYEELNHAN